MLRPGLRSSEERASTRPVWGHSCGHPCFSKGADHEPPPGDAAPARTDLFPQISQMYGFSPECRRKCVCKLPACKERSSSSTSVAEGELF